MDADLLIVGAGPAGSVTALALAQRWPDLARRTLLVDAAPPGRPKDCGGVIAGRALAPLARLVGSLPGVPQQPVRHLIVAHGDRCRRHPLDRPALAVDRAAFDAALVDAARAAGVAVHAPTRLQTLAHRPGGWRATLAGPGGPCDLDVRLVLGADGALGPVRRLAGLPRGRSRARLALTERVATATDPPPDTLVFELPTTLALAGYYWSFPAPRASGPVLRSHGLFHHGPGATRDLAAHLAARLAARPNRPPGPEPAVRTAVQRLYQPGLPCAAPGVGLVGEAVGADPLSGEGLAQAILTAERAAEELARALAQGDLRLAGWTGRLLGDEGRVLGQNAVAALLAYGPLQARVSRLVMASPVLSDVALRRFCGLRHRPAERWSALARLARDILGPPP